MHPYFLPALGFPMVGKCAEFLICLISNVNYAQFCPWPRELHNFAKEEARTHVVDNQGLCRWLRGMPIVLVLWSAGPCVWRLSIPCTLGDW